MIFLQNKFCSQRAFINGICSILCKNNICKAHNLTINKPLTHLEYKNNKMVNPDNKIVQQFYISKKIKKKILTEENSADVLNLLNYQMFKKCIRHNTNT